MMEENITENKKKAKRKKKAENKKKKEVIADVLLRRPDFDIPLNHKKNLSLQLFNLSPPFGISKWNTSAQHQSPADKGGTSGVTSTIPSFRGSLTLEAALALSLFLFVCTTFLMIFPAMQVQLAIRQAAEQTAEEVAVLSSIPLADSLAAALPDGWGNEAAHLAGNGAWHALSPGEDSSVG